MTQEKKQELTQLLSESLRYLEIRYLNRFPLSVNQCKQNLQQSRKHWDNHDISITNKDIETKLLNFIRDKFAPFIHHDKIQPVSFSYTYGVSIEILLGQILKIAIVHGAEIAVSKIDESTQNAQGEFQFVTLLEGIQINEKIDIFEGVKLVPTSRLESELPAYLPNPYFSTREDFTDRTLLILDAFVSPLFAKPDAKKNPHDLFKRQTKWELSPNRDFYDEFCKILSLACNSAVKNSIQWGFLAVDEVFNVRRDSSLYQKNDELTTAISKSTHNNVKAGQPQIDEAKRMYQIFNNIDSDVRGKLQIPINRWVKSKIVSNPVDKIIDLGIAFESLYLSDRDGNSELSFQLRLLASRYLGKDEEHRKRLMDEFKAIYNLRSKAVHTGKVPEKIKIRKGEERPATSEFIPKAQDLCRESIIKILEDGEFPDPNNLILG